MRRRTVVLGGGTGGTLVANRLRRRLGHDVAITVVDVDDDHVYQPGLLFVPFGVVEPGRLVRPRRQQLRAGVASEFSAVVRVDIDDDRVHLRDGTALEYDVLVIATGARLVPEETDGLTGRGRGESVHTFYDLDGPRRSPRRCDGWTAAASS